MHAASLALIAASLNFTAPSPVTPLTLWYRQPAVEWTQALPLGNGRLGAMVFGGVTRERLQLNENTFWSGGPYNPAHTDALAQLPEARRLIFAGQYAEAQKLVNDTMLGRPSGQMSYQPVGDLLLDFPEMSEVSAYQRSLDLDTAVAVTSYTAGAVSYRREAFISPVDQVIAMRLTVDKPGQLAFNARLDSPQRHEIAGDGPSGLCMRGTGPAYRDIPGALRFTCRLRVAACDGTVTIAGEEARVTGASEVVLLVAIATNYRSWEDITGDPDIITQERIDAASVRPYGELLDRSVADHQALFRRVTLDLGTTDAANKPTDERIHAAAQGVSDPGLAALYFLYGRYLLIASSRAGGQPANLQGLWNESTQPPWDSKYTININTEMNYWPAESCNLSECGDPLVQMLRELSVSGARTARTMFGAKGWVCFHNTDLWRATAPIDGPWAYTPTCGAWLAMYAWERYLFSQDREYLASAYPILEGAALFFLDTLVEHPERGWLVTCPSASPENQHAGMYVCAGPAMDTEILRDLFSACIESCRILGKDKAFRAKLESARSKLPPDQIGRDGQLQEWLDDWDTKAGADLHHRHVSHLYALYPSAQISPLATPELAAAARKSLELRGDDATGWSLAWKVNLWARLRDGDRASRLLSMLLGPERTYPNMLDAHPPFQIDGNFGGASGIVEMLLQSQERDAEGRFILDLLPALPQVWSSGSVTGLRARGGFEVSLKWEGGRLVSATITSRGVGKCEVRYDGALWACDTGPGKPWTWPPQG